MSNNIISSSNEGGNQIIKSENDIFGVAFLKQDFAFEKEKTSFIKKVESQIRSSREYASFISYIREELQFNHCTILNNLDSGSVSIEMHHHPFTLYDLVETEVNKYIMTGQGFNSFIIAHNVLLTHYENLVGLIALSRTMHELIHSNKEILIPKQLVIGNYNDYFLANSKFMDENTINKFNEWSSNSVDINTGNIPDMLGIELFDKDKRIAQLGKTNIYKKDLLENNMLSEVNDEC